MSTISKCIMIELAVGLKFCKTYANRTYVEPSLQILNKK